MADPAPASPPASPPAIRATAMAADANPYGKMFVGWLMGQMALAAGSVASQRCRGRAPVVAADHFTFTVPIEIGDEISIWAEIVAEGRSSMSISVSLWRRPRHDRDSELAASGHFTLVSMGDDDRPRAIDGPFI